MQQKKTETFRTTPLATVILLGIALSGSVAHASSADSWNKLRQDTRKACFEASEFKNPKVIEGPIMFTSAVLYRIGGIWPQKHMEGQAGKVYCLHPYPDGKPEITE